MELSRSARKGAALCLATFAPIGAIWSAAAAQAAASASDCVELHTLNSGFATVVQDVIDPKELGKLTRGAGPKSADAAREALGPGMAKRLFETDPVTGRPRMELFIEHIRDLDALARDSSCAFDDPEGAEAVRTLSDGLDGYLDFYDKLTGQQDGARPESGGAADGSAETADFHDELKPVLGAFNAGIDAFTDYSEQAGCAAA